MKGLFFLIVLAISSTSYGTKDVCFKTPCDNLTTFGVLVRLWSTATNLSPFGRKIQNDIIYQAQRLPKNDSQVFLLLIQTLWAVEIYSNYQHPTLLTSCVFEDIINLQLNPNLTNAQYNQALGNYGDLVGGAVAFTIGSSLRVAGCPYNTTNTPPRPEECACGGTIKMFLDNKECSSSLARNIRRLCKSGDFRDRTFAMVLAAFSNGPLITLYIEVSKTDELLNALRLKACKIKIPSRCCDDRREEVIRRLNAVGPVVMRILGGLMKK